MKSVLTQAMPKVLIVEDQPAVARALRLLFELHDIESVTSPTPAAAARALARGGIDVVVQDMNFTPGATAGEEGIEFFRRVRAVAPGTPVVLLTAWTSLEHAVQLVKEGASDYLAKPWDDEKLISIVRALAELRSASGEGADADAAEAFTRADLQNLVVASPTMRRVVSLALQVAPTSASVLITGPNGAGKEKIADLIQANSRRRGRPFVKVNTGAIPDELIESELFGAEPGAFTGANRLRVGRFEAANGGTIFLDEIGNLSMAGQSKLLRVLQSGEFERLGSNETRRADVRLLCATNVDLRAAIERGRFREDLYFRLNVVEVRVPPLRERREEIEPLARSFVAEAAAANEMSAPELTSDAISALVREEWPGNVRELHNRILRAVVMSRGRPLTAATVAATPGPTIADDHVLEKRTIELAILNASGSISRAAEALGMSRQALYRRMEKLGVVVERRPRS